MSAVNAHGPQADFFISFTQADRNWAEWIAWVLEGAGYTTILAPWDFRPGANFIRETDRAIRESNRTIAVLSASYLNSDIGMAEWGMTLANDPRGEARLLIPVRVGTCEPRGLLGQIIPIDLVGLAEKDAIQALVDGVRSGRAKPAESPEFPSRT